MVNDLDINLAKSTTLELIGWSIGVETTDRPSVDALKTTFRTCFSKLRHFGFDFDCSVSTP